MAENIALVEANGASIAVHVKAVEGLVDKFRNIPVRQVKEMIGTAPWASVTLDLGKNIKELFGPVSFSPMPQVAISPEVAVRKLAPLFAGARGVIGVGVAQDGSVTVITDQSVKSLESIFPRADIHGCPVALFRASKMPLLCTGDDTRNALSFGHLYSCQTDATISGELKGRPGTLTCLLEPVVGDSAPLAVTCDHVVIADSLQELCPAALVRKLNGTAATDDQNVFQGASDEHCVITGGFPGFKHPFAVMRPYFSAIGGKYDLAVMRLHDNVKLTKACCIL
eukprot:TRINITY_DN14774_c0_g1_i1.p1 TRINITY_DN14774_c0_g1~~TRINITY_DN14774_c0_g1_i1.p1  ORF type:complete len:326 (-),score=57.30 TRINITY_DN14774_c0_g1_i1:270-1115(-)